MMQPRIVILKDGVDTSQGPPQCHRDAGKLTAAAAATAMALGSLLLCLLCVCCSTGKGQLISNINACEAVTEILKTTLGPRGQCQPHHPSARAPSNCSQRAWGSHNCSQQPQQQRLRAEQTGTVADE
jgi:hypothetical protein